MANTKHKVELQSLVSMSPIVTTLASSSSTTRDTSKHLIQSLTYTEDGMVALSFVVKTKKKGKLFFDVQEAIDYYNKKK